jgi:uncharacterized protein (DUF488 family)
MVLYTVGYEGCEISEFVTFLAKKKIEVIADVRKNPISRKKGFSKNKLAAHLREKQIDYVHFKGLGVPSEWRKRAKAKLITRERMFEDYKEKILPEHTEELSEIRKLASEKKLALLCYEHEADDCHRHQVSDRLKRAAKGRLKVVDLLIPVAKRYWGLHH